MTWFFDWWNALSILQQGFAVVAIPATVILVLQTILLLFGLGGGQDADADVGDTDIGDVDADTDADMDADVDTDALDHDPAEHVAGLRIFTVRGMVAFFAIGGWLGIALGDTPLSTPVIGLIALLGGTAALLLTAWLIKWSLSLQDQGNLNLQWAVGKTAQVYIPIPADGKSSGKVTMTLQERYVELSAVTTATRSLHTDEMVKVTGVVNQSVLVVRPLNEA